MTVYSYEYSQVYEPPAPVFDIEISKPGESSIDVSLPALVDSGADATLIPITALRDIGARYVETRQMRGVAGIAYPVDLYLVTVRIGAYTVPAVRAVAVAPNGETIVGRDVLSQLIVTLNGPASVAEVTR